MTFEMSHVILLLTYYKLIFHLGMTMSAWYVLWRIDYTRVRDGRQPQCDSWADRLLWANLWPLLFGLALGDWFLRLTVGASALYEKLTDRPKQL
ncbi:MAG: hypothetical protein ACFFD1_00995 [Candidatus Thorarchaeota archaeon]